MPQSINNNIFSQKKMKIMHIYATCNIISSEYIFPIFGVLANVPIVVLQNGSVFARNTKKILIPSFANAPIVVLLSRLRLFLQAE